MRGVIASESANNAKEGGALIPTIAFGVPGSASMALLLGACAAAGSTLVFVSDDERLAAAFDQRLALPSLNRAPAR